MELPDFLTCDKYGFIHITDHRIGLRHFVQFYREGYAPERFREQFPTLPLALIHQVIAFYLEHQAEVDAYVAQARAALDELAAAPQPGPDHAELRRRMDAKRRAESA